MFHEMHNANSNINSIAGRSLQSFTYGAEKGIIQKTNETIE